MGSKGKMATRGLSEIFINRLLNGEFAQILERVLLDQTLDMEIRNSYVNIYYRGGNLMRITERTDGRYEFFFDRKYITGKFHNHVPELVNIITNRDDIDRWVCGIDVMKDSMDVWFGHHPKEEREYQQTVVRDNNRSSVAGGTDYFIVDMEYDNHIDARFDLVAIKWESNATKRKLHKGYLPKLCVIEMKYGDGALTGKSGMKAHVEQLKRFFENDEKADSFKKEMLHIFSQKRTLGLIPKLEGKNNHIKEFAAEIDVIFLIANHDPESRLLKDCVSVLEKSNDSLPFSVKFCTSTFMGYGLYKEGVHEISYFKEHSGFFSSKETSGGC